MEEAKQTLYKVYTEKAGFHRNLIGWQEPEIFGSGFVEFLTNDGNIVVVQKSDIIRIETQYNPSKNLKP